MGGSGTECENTYRLVVNPCGDAAEQFIEFHAKDMTAVFRVAERLFLNRTIAVYRDGRVLCRLFIAARGGYWVINPPRGAETALPGFHACAQSARHGHLAA